MIRKSTAPRLIAVTASLDAAEAGHHDRAHRREQRQRLVEDVQPVGVGQPQVDDERVVGEAVQPVAPIGGIRRLRHIEPVGLETVGDHLPQRRVVLDQEYGEASRFSHGRGEPGQRP